MDKNLLKEISEQGRIPKSFEVRGKLRDSKDIAYPPFLRSWRYKSIVNNEHFGPSCSLFPQFGSIFLYYTAALISRMQLKVLKSRNLERYILVAGLLRHDELLYRARSIISMPVLK
mgnify:CR=1 FL=1